MVASAVHGRGSQAWGSRQAGVAKQAPYRVELLWRTRPVVLGKEPSDGSEVKVKGGKSRVARHATGQDQEGGGEGDNKCHERNGWDGRMDGMEAGRHRGSNRRDGEAGPSNATASKQSTGPPQVGKNVDKGGDDSAPRAQVERLRSSPGWMTDSPPFPPPRCRSREGGGNGERWLFCSGRRALVAGGASPHLTYCLMLLMDLMAPHHGPYGPHHGSPGSGRFCHRDISIARPRGVRALTFTQSRSPSQRQCEVTAGLAGTTRWLFCSSGDRARGLSPMPRTKDEARHPLGPVPPPPPGSSAGCGPGVAREPGKPLRPRLHAVARSRLTIARTSVATSLPSPHLQSIRYRNGLRVEHRRYTECQMYMPTVRWRPCGAQNKSPRVSMFMPPGVAPRGPALSPLRAPCGGDHAAKAQGTPARLEDDSLSVAVAGTSGQGRATWWLQLFPNLLRCPAMSCTSLHAAVTSSGCKPATSTARKAPPHPDCHCSAATHLAGS
ncbi:hypothetical protein PCL_08770 [Purpureocillium lilacinum]|uniref:Uncharacterized protein n=1 Tax=Purpureocillium lilacinum TaxID=33203 RepID=A0A2U3EG42_PURLI|nr:hypothetical protein PCL_08770 [Purpureocillium lilacinum]